MSAILIVLSFLAAAVGTGMAIPVQLPPPIKTFGPIPPPPPLKTSSPVTPSQTVPWVSTVNLSGIPEDADLNLPGLFADAKNNIYLPSKIRFPIVAVSDYEWEDLTVSVGNNYLCYCNVSVRFYKVSASTGRLLETFRDDFTETWLSPPQDYVNNVVASCKTRSMAATVDADGKNLYWAAIIRLPVIGVEDEDGDYDGSSTYRAFYLLRRIQLSTGRATTVIRINDTRQAQSRTGFTNAEITGLAVRGSDTLLVQLYTYAPQDNYPSMPYGPYMGVLNMTSGSFKLSIVGLGLGYAAWAYDDSARELHLLYPATGVEGSRGAPPCDPRVPPACGLTAGTAFNPDTIADCSAHVLVSVSDTGPGLQRPRLAPFETYLRSPNYVYYQPHPVSMACLVGGRSRSNRSVAVFIADYDTCQIQRVDPVTGNFTVVAGVGYRNMSVAGQGAKQAEAGEVGFASVCVFGAADGPAAGAPIGRPRGLVRGGPGTLFFLEEGPSPAVPRIRSLTNVVV